jgi:4-hydroxyphenylpyruvate dioxygenase
VDIAFVVDDLESLSAKIARLGIPIKHQTLTTSTAPQIVIPGWGDYQHTLMTVASHPRSPANTPESSAIASIDHVVLNVGKDQLNAAAHWYRELFGFQIQQAFDIQTDYSGLYSQALVDPTGQVQFNINEPSTPTSQIQTFLDIHNGAGIQHIGLRTCDIVTAVDQMRERGLSFLSIPRHYYANLLDRMEQTSHFPCHQQEWQEIEKLEILLDWPATDRSSLLLQIFTQPIFEQPTFFLEIIERRHQAQGFGEGNFLALFQAMEAAELSQGS